MFLGCDYPQDFSRGAFIDFLNMSGVAENIVLVRSFHVIFVILVMWIEKLHVILEGMS